MLPSYPKLNFPPINLRAKRHEDGKTISVWCATRACYLVLTPEEWVRRHLVEFIKNKYALSPTEMIEEYPIPLNGQPQRADLVVVKGTKPTLLVECKAPNIKLTSQTLAQAMRYNSVVNAKYIILTNGITHLCFESHDGECTPLESFPSVI